MQNEKNMYDFRLMYQAKHVLFIKQLWSWNHFGFLHCVTPNKHTYMFISRGKILLVFWKFLCFFSDQWKLISDQYSHNNAKY